jgi:hypothetical protein
MGDANKLVEILKKHFPAADVKRKYDTETYDHVTIAINSFIFADYEMERLFEAKKESGYGGFYMTPRDERESTARHFITFHK